MGFRKLALAAKLAVTTLGSIGAAGVAQAQPMLQIVDGAGAGRQAPATTPCTLNAAGYNECEVTGDAGGTQYPWPNNNIPGGAGAGIPSAGGGWPIGPGFAQDGSFNNFFGTSGWHESYLNLTQSANITFQYMGDGNAANHNQFQVFIGGVWTTLFDNNQTTPCATTSPTTFNCQPTAIDTFFFNAGLIPFRYLASIGTANADTFTNNVTGGNPDPNVGRGGYFLGCDPYLVAGPYQNSCNVAYAGLTDLPANVGTEHDYQDMAVRITVPEPGSLFLVGGGLLGLAGLRRRKA